MRTTIRSIGRRTALLGLAPVTAALAIASHGLTLEPQSRIWVAGTSTVRSFQCKATEIDAAVQATSPAAATAVMAGDKAVTSVQITIPAARLDCANGTMNEHMLKAIKAKENPTITFRLSTYELAKAAEGMTVTLTGDLTLGGTQKPVTVTATAEDADGMLHVTGKYQLRMTEFGLKPPSLMMGTMKVNEKVDVNFDLFLKG
jgi:polyisoprenoid-binding protein YceI